MTNTLHIYLFGELRIFIDETPLAFYVRPKAIPLWAYLLLHRERPLPRDEVAAALWPETPERSARVNLRRHLFQLKRALPSTPDNIPWILNDHHTVRWNPAASYWLDVAVFEQLCHSEQSLESAVVHYTGDLLENVYEDWLFYERERLRDLYLTSLMRLVARNRARRDYVKALAYARALLRHDPFREDAVRQVMLIEYDVGNRAGALSEYERFVQLLASELGVTPMPETTSLYERIAHNIPIYGLEPTTRPTAVLRERPTKLVLPFVGQDTAMGQLRTWWRRATQARGGVVFVGGAAGVGKTRLVREFSTWVETQQGQILYGASAPIETLPYQAFVQALDSVLAQVIASDIPPLWLAALLPAWPALHDHLPDLALPVPLGADQERKRFFEAVIRVLMGLATARPTLLILEDLHWATEGTRDLLTALASRVVGQTALLVLVTYREEEEPQIHPLRHLRRRMQQTRLAAHLTLNPLPSEDIETLIHGLTGLRREAAALVRVLYDRSAGNPLFVQELLHDWLIGGEIKAQNKRWSVDALNPWTVPGNLRSLVVRRLRRLPKGVRELMQALAVIGPAFALPLLREVVTWNEDKVLDALHVLRQHYLIRAVDPETLLEYEFVHTFIQELIYADLSEPVRRRMHRRVAHVMEELYAQQLDAWAGVVARHYDRSGLAAPTDALYLRAARHALSLYADAEALAFIDRGLVLTEDSRLRWDLLALRERIHSRRDEPEQQRANLAAMERLAYALNDEARICQFLLKQIEFHHLRGERDQEATLIEELKTWNAMLGSPYWHAETLRVEAVHALSLARYNQARYLLEAALEQYRALDDREGLVRCYCRLAEIATQRGEFDAVTPLLDEAQAVAETQANYVLMVRVMLLAASAVDESPGPHSAAIGDTQRAIEVERALGQRALDLCRRIGYREGEAQAHKLLGTILSLDVQAAHRHHERAYELYVALGLPAGQAEVQLNIGALDIQLGHYRDAVTAFRRAAGLFEQLRDLPGQASSILRLSEVLLLLGDYAEARAAAQRAMMLGRVLQSMTIEAQALIHLGEAERQIGQFSTAVAHLEAGLALLRSCDSELADLGHALCQLTLTYLRKQDLLAARQTVEDMLIVLGIDESATSYPATAHPQLILWAAAQAYRALGETARAQTLLKSASLALLKRAETIPDPDSRNAFWQLPFNREIIVAYEQRIWP